MFSVVGDQSTTLGQSSRDRQTVTHFFFFPICFAFFFVYSFLPTKVCGSDQPSQYFFHAKTCVKTRKNGSFRGGTPPGSNARRNPWGPVRTCGDPRLLLGLFFHLQDVFCSLRPQHNAGPRRSQTAVRDALLLVSNSSSDTSEVRSNSPL